MTKNDLLPIKSKKFALQIIRIYTFLRDDKKEFVLSKQILKSGTSIGANIREAIRGQSKADFYAKLFISLKEAEETEYWLELLYESNLISETDFKDLYAACEEILKLLMATVKHKV